MTDPKHAKLGGYLFIAAGCLFCLSAYLGRQTTNVAIGAAFFTIGSAFLVRAKRG